MIHSLRGDHTPAGNIVVQDMPLFYREPKGTTDDALATVLAHDAAVADCRAGDGLEAFLRQFPVVRRTARLTNEWTEQGFRGRLLSNEVGVGNTLCASVGRSYYS